MIQTYYWQGEQPSTGTSKGFSRTNWTIFIPRQIDHRVHEEFKTACGVATGITVAFWPILAGAGILWQFNLGPIRAFLSEHYLITDPKLKSKIGPDLRESKLNPYWEEYFHYQREARDLHSLSERALKEAIENARHSRSHHLDAQQAISLILTDFGSKHNFHRQFNEQFSYKPAQILGMQLYSLVVADQDWWIYTETQHRGHVYPHATYFMSPDNPEYIAFVQQQQ